MSPAWVSRDLEKSLIASWLSVVSQVQDFTHLKYETSKESTRDCEKVGHSETEDETGKLAVAKSEMRNY